MISLILFLLAVLGYSTAAILFQRALAGKSSGIRTARYVLLGTLLLHTASIVANAIEEPAASFTTVAKTAPTVAWFIVVIYLFLGRHSEVNASAGALGTFAAPAAAVLMLAAAASSGVPTVHKSWSHWREIHVMGFFFGFAALLLATFCAVLYLSVSSMLKHKQVKRPLQRLPSLEQLDRWSHLLIALGFPALGLGWIAAGVTHGSFWRGTMSEYLTLATILLYAAYIHIRLVSGWQGRKVNALLIAGSILLGLTYAGVSLLPGGAFHP